MSRRSSICRTISRERIRVEGSRPGTSPVEDSAAPLLPQATCYECPRSTCDGFLYLRSDQGREVWCPKCGFVIALAADAKIDELESPNSKSESRKVLSVWNLGALLIVVLVGFLIFLWVR